MDSVHEPHSPHLPGRQAGEVAARAARLVYPIISQHDPVVSAVVRHTERCGDQPVAAIQRFKRDVIVRKHSDKVIFKPGKRTVIMEFSHQSRMRLVHTIRNSGVAFRSMLTITYPKSFPSNGRTVKKHLNTFSMWLRRNFYGCKGIWFLEFQRRGAPHFHLLLDIDLASYGLLHQRKRRKVSPGAPFYLTNVETENAAARRWFEIVGSGDPKHLRAGVSWEVLESDQAAERYAAKHASKPSQKEVPEGYFDVGRFWGGIGGVKAEPLDEDQEEATTASVVEEFGPEAVLSTRGKIKKYIWLDEQKDQQDNADRQRAADPSDSA